MVEINNIRFIHPRKSAAFLADLDTQLTVEQVIFELLSPTTGPFLQPLQPGQEYLLVLNRTATAMAPNMTFAAAGVVDNDTLEIILNSKAA